MSQVLPKTAAQPGQGPAADQVSSPPGRVKRGARAKHESRVGQLFVLPFLVIVIMFLALPLGYAFYLSLFTESLALGNRFSGLDNYQKTFTDPVFLEGVKRVIVFSLLQIPVMLLVALAGALVLDALDTKLSAAYRLIAFMPYAVPTVIGALMWGFLYSGTFGPFADIPTLWDGKPINFFSPNVLLISLGNVVTWSFTGYNMIVLYSALRGIPREMYEAAVVDGASHLQIALLIKVPAIARAILLAVIFAVIGTMQFFTEPAILTRFAPDISAGYTPNLYAYNLAFRFSEFHYSAAISFTLGVVVFIASYAFIFISRRKDAQAS